jgi:hypothetical protein
MLLHTLALARDLLLTVCRPCRCVVMLLVLLPVLHSALQHFALGGLG